MKGYEWIGWLATSFLGLTIINRILEGTFISAADVEILNQTSITQNVSFGFFSVPIPGAGFIAAIWKMLSADYSFFSGNAQVFYFFYQTVTIMIGFGLVITLISIAVNAIRGR